MKTSITLTIIGFAALGSFPTDANAQNIQTTQNLSDRAIQTQEYVFLKEGTLIRGSNSLVYLINAGKRRLIPDQSTFSALGYKQENVQRISDEQLSTIPELPAVNKYRIAYKNGTLLKGEAPAVYVISSGGRRLIPNEATFEAMGYQWTDIQRISDRELKSIPEYSALPTYATSYAEGTLLKGSGAEIYIIINGKRRLIPDQDTFNNLGYKLENVQQISDEKLNFILELPPIASKAGANYK